MDILRFAFLAFMTLVELYPEFFILSVSYAVAYLALIWFTDDFTLRFGLMLAMAPILEILYFAFGLGWGGLDLNFIFECPHLMPMVGKIGFAIGMILCGAWYKRRRHAARVLKEQS